VKFDGKIFPAATLNGELLGPAIHVAVGERLRLSVVLSSAVRDLSIHFHGFEMKNRQVYDGVVGITQCAIRCVKQSHYFSLADWSWL
jgi:FtsP/CotA-like multicopper oxidase with cupredoxin domain